MDAIAAAPDDDTPRLVYADWLAERGELPRASAIRHGVAKPWRIGFEEGVEAFVCYPGTRDDVAGVAQVTVARSYPGVRWMTYKGMVEYVICSWKAWLAMEEILLASEWVPEVAFTDMPDYSLTEWKLKKGTQPLGNKTRDRGELRPRIGRGSKSLGAHISPLFSEVWPAVKRWAFPEYIVARLGSFGGARERLVSAAHPPSVGDLVRGTLLGVREGTTGVLLAPLDNKGCAPIRPKQVTWVEGHYEVS